MLNVQKAMKILEIAMCKWKMSEKIKRSRSCTNDTLWKNVPFPMRAFNWNILIRLNLRDISFFSLSFRMNGNILEPYCEWAWEKMFLTVRPFFVHSFSFVLNVIKSVILRAILQHLHLAALDYVKFRFWFKREIHKQRIRIALL